MSGTKELIEIALKMCDGKKYRLAKELSKLLGRDVPVTSVYHWLNGTPVNPTLCHAIQVLTSGAVQVHELRPDVFPAPGQLLPQPEVLGGKRHAGSD